MKKHNEGYALPFVLVVMLVLAIVATTVMSAALQNLQTQQRTIDRMQDKYAAQGAIEKVVAQLNQGFVLSDFELPEREDGQSDEEFKTEIADAIKRAINAEITKICNNVNGTKPELPAQADTQYEETSITYECEATFESIFANVEVKCMLKCKGKLWDYTENEGTSNEKTHYAIISPTISYESYEISNVESTDPPSIAISTETTTGGDGT